MDSLKKLQKLGTTGKKVFIYGVLFVLAVPLLILVVVNLQNRMDRLEGENLMDNIEFPVVEDETGLEEIWQELQALTEMVVSTSTATSTATTTEN